MSAKSWRDGDPARERALVTSPTVCTVAAPAPSTCLSSLERAAKPAPPPPVPALSPPSPTRKRIDASNCVGKSSRCPVEAIEVNDAASTALSRPIEGDANASCSSERCLSTTATTKTSTNPQRYATSRSGRSQWTESRTSSRMSGCDGVHLRLARRLQVDLFRRQQHARSARKAKQNANTKPCYLPWDPSTCHIAAVR